MQLQGEVLGCACETWWLKPASAGMKGAASSGRPNPGEFLSMTAVQMTAHHTDTSVHKQQSQPRFPAWEASCSKLCGLGLSSVFQEAFRPIKSLMITSQLFVQWLCFCLCCRLAACLCINCLKHTRDKTKIHLPAPLLSSPDHTLPRRGETSSPEFTVPGS